jgi:transposase
MEPENRSSRYRLGRSLGLVHHSAGKRETPKRRTSQGAEYPALTEALVGRFAAHHGAVARAILDHIDFLDAGIARLDEQVAASLEPFRAAVTVLETIPGVGTRVAETIGPAPRPPTGARRSAYRRQHGRRLVRIGHASRWCPPAYDEAEPPAVARASH